MNLTPPQKKTHYSTKTETFTNTQEIILLARSPFSSREHISERSLNQKKIIKERHYPTGSTRQFRRYVLAGNRNLAELTKHLETEREKTPQGEGDFLNIVVVENSYTIYTKTHTHKTTFHYLLSRY